VSSVLKQFQQSSLLAGGNADYVESQYEAWLENPASVSAEWGKYFDTFKGREAGDVPHSLVRERIEVAAKLAPRLGPSTVVSDAYSESQGGVRKLVTAYRSRGHLGADLDPLGMAGKADAPDLDLPFHGLSDADLDVEFTTYAFFGVERMKLRTLLSALRATYSSSIGAEFMHISDAAQRNWIYRRMENAGGKFGFDAKTKKHILERLTAAEGLERYLHTKFVGQKRFSLEGGDSLIPLLDVVVEHSGRAAIKELVIGMAHRGRLNVLVNTLGKPPHKLFDEFQGKFDQPDLPDHSGDVKYHMGFSSDVKTSAGSVHLALAFNPSHLEIVDPVVAGSVRARQVRREDSAREQAMSLLIHGDASFAGQGVVMETLQMSQARGFAVGGTLHVVVNNQVGFTTSRADDARSTLYSTDVAKFVGAPVFHVNGDDPEAVAFVAQMAFDYRREFKRDVVIDLVCYRRHGHNEADEPAATQPLMYQNIRARKTTRELYADKLQSAGVIAAGEAQQMVDTYREKLDQGTVTTTLAGPDASVETIDWSPFLKGTLAQEVSTGVLRNNLVDLARTITTLPDGFTLHPRVAKIYDDRKKMAAGELAGDWGFAENLAYATLLKEGYRLRLVGQDAGRGTFFHRHAALHDQHTGQVYLPLAQLAKNPEHVTVIDSLLSEEAVMAYEYGYTTSDPHTMGIWEAQFGDFANGAQVVIDQFISSGEAKWGRLSGLALFLPHGYEGQGPEHSSARLERFLQLCALDNMQVCVPTTPAQAFHMIRRQMVRPTRKPLVVMTPKSLLRHKLAVSSLDDMANGHFQRLIPDSFAAQPDKVTRVIACSGRVYYDLLEEAEKRGLGNVALVRVEQLYPFPREALVAEIKRFPKATDLVWCQEEPMNQGAWYQIQHHLRFCLQGKQKLSYTGRVRSAAPAAGQHSTHVAEQARLVEDALVAPLNGDHVAE
jgi:2-oxoglutarate dehydrogenase E1 component